MCKDTGLRWGGRFPSNSVISNERFGLTAADLRPAVQRHGPERPAAFGRCAMEVEEGERLGALRSGYRLVNRIEGAFCSLSCISSRCKSAAPRVRRLVRS